MSWSTLPRSTKPMRRVSKTNKRWNAPGRARPKDPLADWCEAAIEGVCTGRATDRHHIIPRGPGSSDEAWNTMDVCRACHRHIEEHRDWAKQVGFLRSRPPVRCPGLDCEPGDELPDGRRVCMGCGHGFELVDGVLPEHPRVVAS